MQDDYDDFTDGMQAFHDGDFKKATRLLAEWANRDQPDALYVRGAIHLNRGELYQATRDLTTAALKGQDMALELLHDPRLTLNPEELVPDEFYDFDDEAVLELWATIKSPAPKVVHVEQSVEQILITEDSIFPDGLDSQTTQRYRDLQLHAKTHNDSVRANQLKEKNNLTKLVVFTVVASIPAYLIGGQLGGATFLGVWALLYFATGGF